MLIRDTNRSRAKIGGVALLAIAILAVALIVVLGGASSEPSATDMKAISGLINQFMKTQHVAWPQDALAVKTLPQASTQAIQAERQAILGAVGTPEFAEKEDFDWASYLQERRDGDGVVLTAYEYKILDVVFVRGAGVDVGGIDSVVVRAKVWDAATTGVWSDEKEAIIDASTVDGTPVWEYVVTKVDGHWKLAEQKLVERSEDDSSSESGPDTPHVQIPVAD